MSYYQQINGVQYDHKLLEKATALTRGQDDGRISAKDAHLLWLETRDGSGTTKVEKRTIRYILDNYNLTRPAKRYFEELTNPKYDADEFYRVARQIAADEFGIPRTNFQGIIPSRIKK